MFWIHEEILEKVLKKCIFIIIRHKEHETLTYLRPLIN